MKITGIIVRVALVCVVALGGFDTAFAADSTPRVVFVKDSSAAATKKAKKIRRFGNKKRIAKLTQSESDSSRVYILTRDREVRPTYEKVRRFGNTNRIAKRIDASVKDQSGKVLILKDSVGREELVAMKKLGNRHRIEKLLMAGGE